MMKTNFLLLLSISVILIASCTSAPKSDEAVTTDAQEVATATEGETWKLDTTASKLEWVGTKVSGYHTGAIKIVSGDIQAKDGNITGGKFTLDMNSIATVGPNGSDAGKNSKLTGHLKSADFFDVAKYPTGTFEITGIKPFAGAVTAENEERQEDISEYKVANPTHTISGNLTLKGVTKNIEFPAAITFSENSIDALAKFNIDRSQWDIVYPGQPDDLIRNEIHLGVALKAVK